MNYARLFLFCLIFSISASVSYANGVVCGATITTDTTLTHNLTCLNSNGLVIGADNIVLNCNGYTIEGHYDFMSMYAGVYNFGHNNVTVKNCKITDFEDGIEYFSGDNGLIENNTLTSNEMSCISFIDASGNTARNNTASSCMIGVYLDGTSSGASVYSNTLVGNTYGVWISGLTNNITYNTITHNSQYGIYTDHWSHNNIVNSNALCTNDHTYDIYNENATNAVSDNNCGAGRKYSMGSAGSCDNACTESNCDDAFDNDADGNTDCDDADCAADPACNALECGDTLTEDTTLTEDLTCSDAGYGLLIGANDITLNCNGFSITRTAPDEGDYGIYNTGHSGVTTKNCVVSNFQWGIYYRDGADNGTIDNNTVTSSLGYGIRVRLSDGVNITNNNASRNGDYGIYLDSSSYDNIVNNTVDSNTNYGIYLGSSSYDNIVNNTVNSNTNDGIYSTSSTHNLISGNTAQHNSRFGLYFVLASNDNTIDDNNFCSNNNTNYDIDDMGANTFSNNFCGAERLFYGGSNHNCTYFCSETGLCDDATDNDADGTTDCDDSDCAADPACLVEVCDNHIDDDLDGYTDCADSDCLGTAECQPSCADTVSNSITLVDDISCPTGNGLNIGSSNIVIDCEGYAIDGNDAGGSGIYNFGYDNVTVKNCRITDFDNGIWYYDGADHGLIQNNTIVSNTNGVFVFFSSTSNLITLNNISNNDFGVYLATMAYNNTVTSNTISHNTQQGIRIVSFAGDYGNVSDNTACHNGLDLYLDGDAINNFGDNTCDSLSDSGVGDTVTCNTTCTETNHCDDGIDNDLDGLADCDDSDCSEDGACVELVCDDAVDNDNDTVMDCADADCDGQSGSNNETCEFGTELTCNDGKDNDGDGHIDCLDSDCNGVGSCEYGAELTCNDTIDNDADGTIDCLDANCNGISNCEFGAELTCNDTSDNDGDGHIDCLDSDCNGVGSCEYGAELTCNDSVDNDGDGNADCQDANCDGISNCEYGTELTCNDTIDNDGNGFADCLDENCDGIGSCEYSAELTCNDSLDNDADGTIDCLDSDCNGISNCEYGAELTCNDSIDNDGDGHIDCLDSDCNGIGTCEYGSELTCNDTVDNDGDTHIDCLDSNCDGIGTCEYATELTCNDSLDNDGDTFIDCTDSDCDGVSNCEYLTELTCDDGIDNDMDGFTDCDDASCFNDNYCKCNRAITQDWTFTEDLECSGYNGLRVRANDITIDCAGYTITGNDTNETYGIMSNGATNVTIKNCDISHFDKGIFFSNGSDNATLDNNSLGSNNYGIYLQSSNGAIITNNSAFENTHSGIVVIESSGTLLKDNTANANAINGIILTGVTDSTVRSNGIASNQAQAGLLLQLNADGNTIDYNNLEGNHYGIMVQNSSNNIFNDNTIHRSFAHGIYIYEDSTNNSFGNTHSCSNSQDGAGYYDMKDEVGTNTFVSSTYDHSGPNNGTYFNLTSTCGHECQDLIVYNTTLINSLECDGTDGLVIGADNVVLDCGGFNLTGTGEHNGIDISGHENVTIINCDISNFYDGIYASHWSTGTVEDSYIHENSCDGLAISYSEEFNVSNSRFVNNSGQCARSGLHTSNAHVNLLNSEFTGNGEYGLYDATPVSVDWTIDGHAICRNNDIDISSANGSINFAGGSLELDNCALSIYDEENGVTKTWNVDGNMTDLVPETLARGGNQTTFNFSNSNTNIDLMLNQTANVSIFVGLLSATQVNQTNPVPPSAETLPFKGIHIEVSNDTRDSLTWAIIKVFYDQAELDAAGIDETTLRMYYYNATADEWQDSIDQQGVNFTNNFVWGNVTHFSVYGLFGEAEVSGGSHGSSHGSGFICTPIWSCTDWGKCSGGMQTRICTASSCLGSNSGKPNETQACPCIENWSCGSWSSCSPEGKQTRECNDMNNCGSKSIRPELEKSCDYSSESSSASDVKSNTQTTTGSSPLENGSSGLPPYTPFLIIGIAALLVLIVIYPKKVWLKKKGK